MSARFLSLACAVALAAIPASAEGRPVFKDGDWVIETPTSLTIRSDGGGNIAAYAALIDDLGVIEVRIVGVCKSACTMFLGAKNVCVSPDASLAFHGPDGKDESIAYLLQLVDQIADHYPPTLARTFREDWGLYQDLTWLTGAELLAMEPGLRSCAGAEPQS